MRQTKLEVEWADSILALKEQASFQFHFFFLFLFFFFQNHFCPICRLRINPPVLSHSRAQSPFVYRHHAFLSFNIHTHTHTHSLFPGFMCRCEHEFCAKHRDAGQHSCTFDYKAFDRARLDANNPVVVARKVPQI